MESVSRSMFVDNHFTRYVCVYGIPPIVLLVLVLSRALPANTLTCNNKESIYAILIWENTISMCAYGIDYNTV